jgi:hypothetical protein
MTKSDNGPRPLWDRRRTPIRLADAIDAFMEPIRQAGRNWRAHADVQKYVRQRETYGDPDEDQKQSDRI